ncbi:hypothetical protein DSL92_05680 [Billgrantia gudaonensis]|uniref:Uncharacterized protein n=1 Tax=Billgrantia gudaonensis TaxID=376427 RepID=A0A432JJQ3_9GAMM|nr:hypothetical protein DSL92_05680 [Halomonas gudaonensis]
MTTTGALAPAWATTGWLTSTTGPPTASTWAGAAVSPTLDRRRRWLPGETGYGVHDVYARWRPATDDRLTLSDGQQPARQAVLRSYQLCGLWRRGGRPARSRPGRAWCQPYRLRAGPRQGARHPFKTVRNNTPR